MTAAKTQEQTKQAASDLYSQAYQTFESAIRLGCKMQEETANRMTEMLGMMGSPQEWQRRNQEMVEEFIPMVEKNLDETLKLMNQNAHTSMEMLEKAFATQRPADVSEMQARTQELWETSLGMVRSNVQNMVQTNSRMMQMWANAMKGNGAGDAKK